MSEKVLFYTLVFGNKSYFLQTQLLMMSLLHHRPSNAVFRIYTDEPDFFSFLQDSVEIELISKEYLQMCINDHNGYVYSSKLDLIRKVAQEKVFAATIFLDTDIVALQPLESFVDELSHGNFFMYKKEKSYSRESRKEYWEALNRINTLGYRLDRDSSQWNSGVVGLKGDCLKRLDDAASIMDQLHEAKVQQHTLEQVAFSIVLEDTGKLKAAQDWFVHYHPNKPAWEPMANELEALKQQACTLPDLIKWFASIQTFPSESPPNRMYLPR